MDKNKRDKLIVKYAPLVKNIVLGLAAKYPIDAADKEDLIHVGIIGLISAVKKFDATRHIQFETYARFRIKGAVLDELRAQDWAPRSMRSKEKKLEDAIAELEKEYGRPPDDGEIAQYLGFSLDKYYTLLDKAKRVTIVSKEELTAEDLLRYESETCMETIDCGSPLDDTIRHEKLACLQKAIDALPEREKLVLSLYYNEELTMKEVGKVIGVTESRVHQLHTQATLKLRSAVKEHWC